MRLGAAQDSDEMGAVPRKAGWRRCPANGEGAQDAHTLRQGALGIFGVRSCCFGWIDGAGILFRV